MLIIVDCIYLNETLTVTNFNPEVKGPKWGMCVYGYQKSL